MQKWGQCNEYGQVSVCKNHCKGERSVYSLIRSNRDKSYGE
jgi:hypothetical protein